MHPEICRNLQMRQFFRGAKNPTGLGTFRGSVGRMKHYISTQLRGRVQSGAGEATGTHTTFSKGGIPPDCAFPPQLRVEMSHWNLLYILGK